MFTDRRVVAVNGFASASVFYCEIRVAGAIDDFERLMRERVAPLLWLAMPGHEH